MNLRDDFRDFAELTNINNSKNLIADRYAMADYRHPRYIDDNKFSVKPDLENEKK